MTFFEDLDCLLNIVGEEVATSHWIEIPQDRIDRFADITEDKQWIHIDPDRAKSESLYGQTIVHGFMLLSLLPQMMSGAITIRRGYRSIVNCGLASVEFLRPVPAGASIRATFRLAAIAKVPFGVQITWEVLVTCISDNKARYRANWIIQYLR